jgi:hypothetical protein
VRNFLSENFFKRELFTLKYRHGEFSTTGPIRSKISEKRSHRLALYCKIISMQKILLSIFDNFYCLFHLRWRSLNFYQKSSYNKFIISPQPLHGISRGQLQHGPRVWGFEDVSLAQKPPSWLPLYPPWIGHAVGTRSSHPSMSHPGRLVRPVHIEPYAEQSLKDGFRIRIL